LLTVGIVFERIDGDDRLLDDIDDDDGARFSFCNSFKCDLPLIIVELNSVEDNWIDCWSGLFIIDDRFSSSAASHKLTFANVEHNFWRPNLKIKEKKNRIYIKIQRINIHQ